MFEKFRLTLATIPYRRRLLFSYIGLTGLTLLVAFGALTALLTGIIAQNETQHLDQLVSVVNADLENRLSGINSRGFDIVIDSAIRESLNQTGDIAIARARTKVESILKVKLISSNDLRSLMIIDTSLHRFSPNVTLVLPEAFRLEDTQVYRDTQAKQGSLVWLEANDIYDRYALDPTYRPDTDIHAAAVIMDYSHRKLLGLMILSLNKNYFSRITYPEGMLSGSRLFLVSPSGRSIYGVAGEAEGLSAEDLAGLTLTGAGGERVDKGRLLVSRYNRTMGWYLVSVTQLTVLNRSVSELTLVLLAVLLVCLALSLVFAQRLAVHGSRGITELIAAMARLEQEDFHAEVPVTRQDELGRITQAFNHMVRRIRELIITEYREKLLMREAQYKALQSQIRPHFLMNTFDMLHWRLMENGQEELAETVVALSHLMRHSVADGQESVPLEEEVQNVREYLTVHTTIRGMDIRLALDVRGGERIMLPRQTLQPLVENAVMHGFSGREHGNVLTLRGDAQTGGYRLEIADNGVGIPPEVLAPLTRMLQNPEAAQGPHIGLRNVASRLVYRCPGALVNLESEYGKGTTVWLWLPDGKEAGDG
ncbi:MAG: histidine kinase [Clostridiales bacterium]|nr:histidine kinase [Clostridiales bacterium]